MSHDVSKELNQVLGGEQMAVEFYENLIHDMDDKRIKGEFQNIQHDHMNHIERITKRIQDIGGKAKHQTGLAKQMAVAVNDMKSRNMGSLEILKKAYNGESKGLSIVEEMVRGDLDSDSMAIIKDICSEDRRHLQKMQHLIDEYTVH